MNRMNRRGGAALVAVLIILILVAAGTAIMIVTGKGKIQETSNIPVIAHDDSSSKADDTQSGTVPDSESQAEPESKPEPEPEPEPEFPEPQKAEKFKEIDFKKLGLSCKYGLLMDIDNNEIVAGINYEKKIYPASLTKVMTLIVAMENIDDKKVKYKFTSKEISKLVEENASRAGFEIGESVSFEDLMYAAILPSGADGTVGLANVVAGSEKKFVELMNKKAEAMGLTGTHFTNTSGLHDKNHYSTLKDMGIILSYALKDKTIKKVLTADTYTTSKTKQHPEGITLYSIVASRLMGWFVDLDGDGNAEGSLLGGKTGFTDEAGFALETIYKYNKKNYICITTKSTSDFNSVADNLAIYENYIKK